MRSSVVSFSIFKSLPVFTPVSIEMADSFEPRSTADKLRVVDADGAVGDESVGATSDIEIGVKLCRLEAMRPLED